MGLTNTAADLAGPDGREGKHARANRSQAGGRVGDDSAPAAASCPAARIHRSGLKWSQSPAPESQGCLN